MVNIRDISVRCGRCLNYQTLARYEAREGWNVYVYECEPACCDGEATRTLVEVPAEIDEFAARHPDCGGGCRDVV